MYSELRSKLSRLENNGLFSILICWLLTNIFAAYSVYFDIRSLGIAHTTLQGSLIVFLSFCYYRWIKSIANVACIRINRLTTDEYAAFSYVIPLTISVIVQSLYSFCSGENWLTRSQTGLVFHLAVIYTVCMILIRKLNYL